MLKLKDKSITAYKGDYHPVELFKNCKKIHGFNTLGMVGDEGVYEDTYNDSLSVFGRSEYAQSVNLCPAPESQNGTFEEDETTYSWEITVKENGYFDFSGSMAIGPLLARMKLDAGTYTASGCTYASLWWEGRNDFLYFPATFTLENETVVYVYLWYSNKTSITLENQYIQIEKGETASDYSPYAGDIYSPPSPDNCRPLVSAGGTFNCEGGNLLSSGFTDADRWVLDVDSNTTNSKKFDLDLQPGKYVFSFENKPLTTYIFLYLQKSNDDWQTTTSIGRPIMNYSIVNEVEFEVEEGYKYRFWSWRLNNNFDLFYNWQIRRISTPNKYYPPHDPVILKISDLKGVEVNADCDYNYSETIDGVEHYYISDRLENQKKEKHIGEIVLDGSMSVYEKQIDNTEIGCYYLDFSDCLKFGRDYDFALCNYFTVLQPQDENSLGVVIGMQDKNIYFFLDKTAFPDAASFSDWIKQKSEENKPPVIYYLLDDVVTEISTTETAFNTFPEYTRLTFLKEGSKPKPGMAKCIKTQIR